MKTMTQFLTRTTAACTPFKVLQSAVKSYEGLIQYGTRQHRIINKIKPMLTSGFHTSLMVKHEDNFNVSDEGKYMISSFY